ncbi:hypothetical protein [Corallococcus sp. 4LFB]|uniref:hypothetical protein n=1 Tax=Corallococcus sp. 4LFB TaxID=3383249 RepID=UPI003975DCED
MCAAAPEPKPALPLGRLCTQVQPRLPMVALRVALPWPPPVGITAPEVSGTVPVFSCCIRSS